MLSLIRYYSDDRSLLEQFEFLLPCFGIDEIIKIGKKCFNFRRKVLPKCLVEFVGLTFRTVGRVKSDSIASFGFKCYVVFTF